jgi:hypothetical protein
MLKVVLGAKLKAEEFAKMMLVLLVLSPLTVTLSVLQWENHAQAVTN